MPSISMVALTRIFPPRCTSRTGSMMSEMMAPFFFLVDSLFDLQGHILSTWIRFCQTVKKKGKMARMILDCPACSSQNFVSEGRRMVRDIPPPFWEGGGILPLSGE